MSDINAHIFKTDKSDLKPGGWIDRIFPPRARPYAYLMRLDRPIGIWLLLLPGWWSIALATPHHSTILNALWLAALFGIGALVMRGAGCIINDLWDQDFDKKVERTRTRPLAAGTLTSWKAGVFLAALLLLGLTVLLQTNVATILLGLLSVPFIIVYPFMKRVTWWPQFFLGLTLNFGALMGWTAITEDLSLPPVLLYIGAIFWTLGYDTIYAHMDRHDDAMIGIKSSARKLGNATKPALILFYSMATLFFFAGAALTGISVPLIIGTGIIAAAFAWQISTLDIHDPVICLRLFKFNRDQAFVILIVFILHALTR